jgi:inner membrane protein
MELPGHLGVAMLVYAPVAALAIERGRHRRARYGLAGVLALAISPDVDLYLPGVAHRTVTHTFLAVAVVGGAVALLAVLIRPRAAGSRVGAVGYGATVGGLGVLSHLLGDVITPMGIRPFLPFSDSTYTLSLVYAANQPANVALLVAGVVVYATATSKARDSAPTGSGPDAPSFRRAPGRLASRLRSLVRP